jgi:tripartite-type tricarboxylate transporter receptor subunit TctC
VLNPAFGPAPPFDLLGAMEPVSVVARTPFIVAANPGVAFNNPKELVMAAKAAPGKLTISSAQLDVYVALLNKRAGTNILHVPYKGGAPATADAIGGQVNMVYALVPVLLPHIQGGKLKAIGLTSAKRVPPLPNTPTFMESGIDFESSVWYGVIAPNGLPKAVRERLAQATQKIVASADFAQKMRMSGADPVYSPPAAFKKQLEGELAFWSQTARAMPQLVK